MIYMLCIILHPQQLFTNKQEPDPANDGSNDTATTDSPSEIDAIGNEVLSIILRRYRERICRNRKCCRKSRKAKSTPQANT